MKSFKITHIFLGIILLSLIAIGAFFVLIPSQQGNVSSIVKTQVRNEFLGSAASWMIWIMIFGVIFLVAYLVILINKKRK